MMPSDGKSDPRVARDARLPWAILCHAVGVMSPPANAGSTDNNKLSVISNQQSAIGNQQSATPSLLFYASAWSRSGAEDDVGCGALGVELADLVNNFSFSRVLYQELDTPRPCRPRRSSS